MSKKLLSENAKCVFKWKIFSIYQWEQEMFNWKKKIFEKAARSDTIDIIAVTNDWKIVILEEQQPWRDFFYWLVWWTCEENEQPIETAKRELLEETWMEAQALDLFGSYQISSKLAYESHIFIAKDCEIIQEQNLDDWGEIIKLKEINWKEFLDFIASDKFKVKEFALEVLKMIYNWKEKELKERIFS